MSGRFLRLACTAAVAAQLALVPQSAAALPGPGTATAGTGATAVGPGSATTSPGAATAAPGTVAASPGTATTVPGKRSVAELLTDLQQLYRATEKATETYNATEEQLKKQSTRAGRLDAELDRARLSLDESRDEAARLARQQYQGSAGISPYLRLLLARDPQHALDEGHVLARLAREQTRTVGRLAGNEHRSRELARKARTAFYTQRTLAERRKKDRDDVHDRLAAVEKLIASLSAEQLTALAEFERTGIAKAQDELITSGALGTGVERKPTPAGEEAVRYAVRQLGKPYEWGAEGPKSYDCSGLTSRAWQDAGTVIPRTSQEQWARLPRIPLTELRPGDLVVYFPEATHVAMYLGHGMVVQAPRPGARVKVSPLAANPVLGAVRPDPAGRPLVSYTPPELPDHALDGKDEGYAPATAPQPAAPQPTTAQPTAPQSTTAQPTAPRQTTAQPAAPRPAASQPSASRPSAPQAYAPQASVPKPSVR
ncbi:C40 family peptidase [Streptomyces adustus]|uniref:C40 family peptidase n=1 Tax=Streptomyces adustus TaxID=1609272 RepID=UPI003715F8B7